MKEYYFLFVLAFAFTLFGSIQDLKKREVANWLNFSFIVFAFAYRIFYSISKKDTQFFLFGLFGFAIFFVLAHVLYYAKAFAGGDAKLLMGFGLILPYYSVKSLFIMPIVFIFVLFFIGAIYSLLYSIGIVVKNKKIFSTQFSNYLKKHKITLVTSLVLFFVSLFFTFINPLLIPLTILFLIPLMYVYTKSLERCMIKSYHYNQLTEGDWLENSVKLTKSITIYKTVHGLSAKDIKLLKKYKKHVLVKEGIPFVPAFLITLILMVFFFLFLPSRLDFLLSLLL